MLELRAGNIFSEIEVISVKRVMRFTVPAVVSVVALAAHYGSALGQQAVGRTVNLTTTGEWQVGLLPPDQGRFTGCTAQIRLEGEGALGLQRGADGRNLILLAVPDAGFPVDQPLSARISLDGKASQAINGVAPQPNVAFFGPVDNEILEGIRKGNRMSLEAQGRTYSVPLKGTGKVVADLRSCVDTQGRGAPQQQAQSGQPQSGGQQQSGQGQNNAPVAATRVVTILPLGLITLLTDAGLQNAQPLILDNVQPAQRPGDFAWRLGQVIGSFQQVMLPPDIGFDDAVSRILEGLKGGCTGDYNPTIADSQVIGPITLKTAKIRCQTGEGPVYASVLVYLTPERSLIRFMHHGPSGEVAQVDKAGEGVLGVIRKEALATAQQPAGVASPPQQDAPKAAKP